MYTPEQCALDYLNTVRQYAGDSFGMNPGDDARISHDLSPIRYHEKTVYWRKSPLRMLHYAPQATDDFLCATTKAVFNILGINPTHKKENDMNDKTVSATTAPAILTTITYVYGVDVKTMNEDDLLATVARIDAERDRIFPLYKSSKAIAKRVDRLQKARAVLISELDSRDE